MLRAFFGRNDKQAREAGQSLVEYALILVLISIVAIATLTAVGASVTQTFTRILEALGGAR